MLIPPVRRYDGAGRALHVPLGPAQSNAYCETAADVKAWGSPCDFAVLAYSMAIIASLP